MIQGHVSVRVWRFKSSPGQSKGIRFEVPVAMNLVRTLVCAVVVAICVVGVLSGCERKTRDYAGLPDSSPEGTIAPHK